ncbi:MAG: 3-deoxy-manno-octulosonate cytidylyltransferase [Rhodobacteraceae bacterium]|nr:3-deoxy-manno-octulosonate cytidylyltransferase [Paracoccaceae bacterium]
MRVVIAIPARYGSTRYPGKPLAALRGAGGTTRSLIERSWMAAQAAARALPGGAQVVVATDDARIAAVARGFGADVAMTSTDCRNGTERCAELAAAVEADVVVNLQGDAPLTPPWFVSALVAAMAADGSVQVATPVLRCDAEALAAFRADRRAGRVGGTTAVFGAGGDALYFSKEVLPFLPEGEDEVWHHVGVYAYRPEALARYARLAPGRLEMLEGLEQLRFLENGLPVRCVPVEARGRVFWELNNPEDVARLESVFAREGTD